MVNQLIRRCQCQTWTKILRGCYTKPGTGQEYNK